jgi:hypothetical protein
MGRRRRHTVARALLAVALLGGAPAAAGQPGSGEPIPYHAGDTWGYADATGRLVIPPTFDKWGTGWVDRTGREYFDPP